MNILFLGAENLSFYGVSYILEKGFPGTGVTTSVIQKVHSALAKEHFDIIVLDCEEAYQYTELLTRELTKTNTPILALVDDMKQIRWLQKHIPSMRGILNRDSSVNQFVSTINLIFDGCYCYSWNVLNIQNISANDFSEDMYETARLTKRERQILELFLAGQSNKAISVTLSRSEKTISAHKSNLLRKLGMQGWQLKVG